MQLLDDINDTDTLLNKQPIKRILDWHEIPAWMQDNVYITGGYRRQTNSYLECAQSLFYLHNESINIWSHFLAFLLFIGIGFHFLYSNPLADSLTSFDYIYFFVFVVGALTCLGFSASFHCFSCHSEKVAATWNRCDYAGITTLIVGSFFPMIYYGFHCHQTLQNVYLSIIVVLGAITATVTLLKHFRTPAYRWLNNAVRTISLSHLILMALTYIAGAVIYGARFPERVKPGMFNYFGASHQIFHVCVVIALLAHYFGVLSAMAFWHDPINQKFCSTLFS
ncbi:hypothetical protein RMCBS344292_02259 [Rhizopus microsporus]|nr:hypothetical protein RMCBS344292_02259 [Rhizopus microsporus]